MTLFKVIIAATKACQGLVGAIRFFIPGNQLSKTIEQEWVNLTTHLRTLNLGLVSISFFSAPRGRMCGMKPWHWTTSSLPTYPASEPKFRCVADVGETTAAWSKGSRARLSCRLAALTSSEIGMPFSSTRTCRFEPFFSPIRRVWTSGLSGQWCFDACTICRLPSPRDSLQFVVFGQTSLPINKDR